MTSHLIGIGTAVPAHSISQMQAAQVLIEAAGLTGDAADFAVAMHRRSGIDRRGSVLLTHTPAESAVATNDFFVCAEPGITAREHKGPTTDDRMRQYVLHAPRLAAQAAANAIARARVTASEITHLVTVSCTGFAAPGVDHALIETLALARTVQRLQIGFTDEYGLQFLGLLQNAEKSLKDITGISLASVVPPLTGRVTQACREYLKQEPLVVDTGIKTGIKVRYEDPKAVGADRICDAVAVMRLFGGPACVIDFGTATTFNALTKDGEYLGGAITAGINLAAEALYTRAAKLPRIDLQTPPSVIGRNTVHAMQSGLLFGYVSMVEGMVTRFRSELGSDMKVIATGGLSESVAKETKVIDIIAPWLTLDGLRIIWELNQ